MLYSSKPTYALVTLLRDLDKDSGFREAKSYTADPNRKAREQEQNWPEHEVRELGRIKPPKFLDFLIEMKPIPRVECRSYEAYMAQYLCWVFHIVNREILQRTLRAGGPQIVAKYLLRQLEAAPDQREHLRRFFEEWEGGVLLK